MPFFYLPCAQGENLSAVDKLDQVLDENEDPEGGQQKDKI